MNEASFEQPNRPFKVGRGMLSSAIPSHVMGSSSPGLDYSVDSKPSTGSYEFIPRLFPRTCHFTLSEGSHALFHPDTWKLNFGTRPCSQADTLKRERGGTVNQKRAPSLPVRERGVDRMKGLWTSYYKVAFRNLAPELQTLTKLVLENHLSSHLGGPATQWNFFLF